VTIQTSRTDDAVADGERVAKVLQLLNLHYDSFWEAAPFAAETGHPVPMDTRGWSQIVVSALTGLRGLERRKGADLEDGSDVKAANTWEAIDTPRFNGVIKAGTQSSVSGTMDSLNAMPYLYLVLWDHTASLDARCRIWVVRPPNDPLFRAMCEAWYAQRASGVIKSNNFQLHPPRGLVFCAVRPADGTYVVVSYDASAPESGYCTRAVSQEIFLVDLEED
jgi:hypothetical protein